MIRYQKIADRTYVVRRNYAVIGYVSEPAHAQSGWFFLTHRLATRPQIVQRFASAYADVGRSQFATRSAATNGLLQELGFDVEPTPNRTTRRSSGRGRAFGVELEITGPGESQIMQALEAHSIEVHNVRSYGRTTGSVWELKHDGSVGGHGIELASPKLRGEDGFRQLEAVCAALNEAGATVDRSCGVHVHHDMRNLEGHQIKRQVLAFVERQELVSQLVAPSRRTNGYCPQWSEAHIAMLRQFSVDSHRALRDIAYIGPRGTINLQAYSRHGSVEIRYHGGSTNFRKLAAWVRFGQALFAAAEAEVFIPTNSVENLLAVLRNHGLTVEDSATLLRFARMGATRAQVEASLVEVREMLEEVTS